MSQQPVERTLEAQLLGREVSFDYSETWVAYSVISLRVIMAWVFLQAGLQKLFGNGLDGFLNDPVTGGFDAHGFLVGATASSPAHGMFTWMAENFWVEPVVVWGQILVGLALLLGVLVRWSAFWGAVMMILFWLAALEGGILQGLPFEHGYVVDYTLVYAFLLFGLGAVGAGRILGLDARIERWPVVERNPWLKYFLG